MESLAHGLLALLDELGVERVSLCGVSLGGMVGMALALAAPERVERLVLACTSAYLGPPEGWAERARIVRAEGMEAIADTVVGPLVHDGARTRGAGDRGALPRDARRDAAGGLRALLRGRSAPGTRGSASPRSPRPCSSIAGEDDPATPVEHAELIASRDRRIARLVGSRARGASRQRRAGGRVHRGRARASRTGGGGSVSDDGMKTRREVLGDEHVDRAIAGTTEFTADFQDLDHPLRLGGDLVAAGPRPPDAELHHDHGARRDGPRARARDARARRAA